MSKPIVTRSTGCRRTHWWIPLFGIAVFVTASAASATISWNSLGPFGGAVTDVAVDPDDGSVLFAGSERGVFHSTDGGGGWSLAGTGFAAVAPEAGVTRLAVDTTPVDLAIWAGTDLAGIVLSTDGGATWNSTDLDGVLVHALLIDPTDSQQVWAGTDGGAARTTDGGTTFAPIRGGLPADPVLTLALGADGSLWAGNDAGGIYVSMDDGLSWSARNTGLPGSAVSALVAEPTDLDVLYAGTEDGVYVTTDGGAGWTASNTGLTDLAIVALGIDALAPSTLFAATEIAGLFVSTDSAAGWSPANGGLTSTAVVDVEIDPDSSSNVFVGTEDMGFFRSADGGTSWQEANQGLALVETPSLAVTHTGPMEGSVGVRLFAGAPGLGVYRSDDSGASWSLVNDGLTRLDVVDVEAAGDRAWAASDGGGVFRSTDAGASWQGTGSPAAEALQVELGPDGSLWAGTDEDGVFLSTDDGVTWSPRSNGLTDSRVRVLAVDPRLAGRLFANTRDGRFRSVDAGLSWSSATTGLGAAEVEDIAFDPASVSADRVWAATDLGVFYSNDGGTTWSATAALPDSLTVAISVEPSGKVRVALEAGGVYLSSDGGAGWQLDAGGLSSATVELVDAMGATWAGTAGGVFSREHDLFSNGFESGDTSAWTSSAP